MDADLTFDPVGSLLPDAFPGADGVFDPDTGEMAFPLPPVKPPGPGEPKRTYVLTPMQDAFARHYVACGNGAEAARRAGYSHANARYLARDNLRHTQVRWRIRDLVAARTRVQRGERVWVLTMLNHALEMAVRQQLPNTMIRALSHMARLSGLEPPPRRARAQADAGATDSAGGSAEMDIWADPDNDDAGRGGNGDLDLAQSLLPDDPPGLLRDAVLGPPDAATPSPLAAPALSRGPGDAAATGEQAGPWIPDQPAAVRDSNRRAADREPDVAGGDDPSTGSLDSRLRGNDGDSAEPMDASTFLHMPPHPAEKPALRQRRSSAENQNERPPQDPGGTAKPALKQRSGSATENEKRPPQRPEGSAAAGPQAAAGVEGVPAAEVGDGVSGPSPGSSGPESGRPGPSATGTG